MGHGRFRLVGKPALVSRSGMVFLGALREVFLINLVVGLVLAVLCQMSSINPLHSSSKNPLADPCHIHPVRDLDFDRDRESLLIYSWPSEFEAIEVGSGIASKQPSPQNLVSTAASERNSTTVMLSQRFNANSVRYIICIVRHRKLLLSEETSLGETASANVRISADGSLALLVGHEGHVIGWDLTSEDPIRWEFQLNHSAHINRLSSDGRWLFAAATPGSSGIYDSRTGALNVAIPTMGDSSRCTAWSCDGERLALANQNGDLSVFETTTGTLIWRDKLDFIFARSLAFSIDGNQLAVGGFDKQIRIWDLSHSAHQPIILAGDSGVAHNLVFISNSTIVSGSDDGKILEWSLATRKMIRQLR